MSEEIEKTDYPKLKNYLLNEYKNEGLSEYTLREIADRTIRDIEHRQNVGFCQNRIEHNEREKAFHDEWLEENDPLSYINNGYGILQDLFITPTGPLGKKKFEIDINSRDRMVSATVIQWLGSNCGMSFLDAALRRFGHKITKI